MTLREIGDDLGLSHKQMRDWSYCHNRELQEIAMGKELRPKGRPRKDGQPPQQNVQKELERLEWKISYCGIFGSPWEGCETNSKICYYLPSSQRVSGIGYVRVI